MLLLLLIPALTIHIGFTLDPLCPHNLSVTAQRVVAPGGSANISINTDIPVRIDYTIIDEDGTLIAGPKKYSGRAAFKPTKDMLYSHLTVNAYTTVDGCDSLNATTTIEVQRASAQKAAVSLPPTPAILPWLIVALATLIAGVLVWKR